MESLGEVDVKERTGYKVIFRQKEYMKLIIASAANRFGYSIDTVAFMMLVYVLTKESTWSVIMFAVNCIPTIFISSFVSGLVEGMNHKRVMVITDIIRGVCVGCISIGYAYGLLQPCMLVVITIVISTVEAFGIPANMALTPKVLKVRYIPPYQSYIRDW